MQHLLFLIEFKVTDSRFMRCFYYIVKVIPIFVH